jgi:hypothetical protein
MKTELFDLPETLSPRLAWLRQHGLHLVKTKTAYECILDADNFGRGDDPDEACIDLCLKTKLPHWNDENYRQA